MSKVMNNLGFEDFNKDFDKPTILNTSTILIFNALAEQLLKINKKSINTFRLYSISRQVIEISKLIDYQVSHIYLEGNPIIEHLKETIDDLILKMKLQLLLNGK